MASQSDPTRFFNQEMAATYDRRAERFGSLLRAMHLLVASAFSNLPVDANVLSVGAGTGAEILALAARFPQWRFTAVDPSAAMLEVFREKATSAGIIDRCELHVGFLDSLPPSASFNAATSILVSQFLVNANDRISFFREIADRLVPSGLLVSADLCCNFESAEGASLLTIWQQIMCDTPEQADAMAATYRRDVAVLPAARVDAIMDAGGFTDRVEMFRAGLIHAWSVRKKCDIGGA